jgi:hypothetical protein
MQGAKGLKGEARAFTKAPGFLLAVFTAMSDSIDFYLPN